MVGGRRMKGSLGDRASGRSWLHRQLPVDGVAVQGRPRADGSVPDGTVTVVTMVPSSITAVTSAETSLSPVSPATACGDGAACGVGAQRELVGLAHVGDGSASRTMTAWARRRVRRPARSPRRAARPRSTVAPADEGDVGDRHLAGVHVRAPTAPAAVTCGWASRAFFDDRRVDVVAAADDQVLGAAG